jgi:N-glycosylase/DNA lyase
MYPKLAAKWGTLIYFGSSFADFTVQRAGVNEKYKIFISMIFPSVATARACKNVSMIEYQTGGSGLDWWNLFTPYNEYRVFLYF